MGTSAFERAWDTPTATPPEKPPTAPKADAFDAAWGTDTPPATPVTAPPAKRPSFLGTQARATVAGVGRSVLKTGARLARAIDTALPGTRFDSGAGETLDRYADALLERLTPADPERAAEFRSGAGGAEMGTELVKYLATGTGAPAAVGALRAATLGTVEDVGSRPGETGAALLAQGAEAVGADRAAAFLREQEQTAPGRAAVGAVLGAVPDVAFRLGRRRLRVPDTPSAPARADVPEPEMPPAAPDVPPIGNRMPPPAAVDEADIARQVDALRREIEAPDVPPPAPPRAPEPPPEFIRPDESAGTRPLTPEARGTMTGGVGEMSRPTPEGIPSPRTSPREYLNYAKFGLDQTAEARLRARVEALRATGEADKGFQSFRDQQAAADAFAKEVVANPLDIDRVKLGKLSGAEIVGLRQVAAENTQMIEGLSQAIESGRLSVEEIREAEQMLEAAVESTNQVLSRVVRETAQTARDLGFLRQMAKLTTDPEAWIVRGKKLLGDAPMSDTVMLEIRRLAREAAEACG